MSRRGAASVSWAERSTERRFAGAMVAVPARGAGAACSALSLAPAESLETADWPPDDDELLSSPLPPPSVAARPIGIASSTRIAAIGAALPYIHVNRGLRGRAGKPAA